MELSIQKNGWKPPSTRYRGSKLKLLDWIWENIRGLKFVSALDAFGGTGSVSYCLKSKGKAVTYNDNLKCNFHVGRALIANSRVKLSDTDVDFLLQRHSHLEYQDVISKTFSRIYFTKSENEWLDTVAQNIPHLKGAYKRSLAYFALFQSCLIKRPYNLFHRRNLYMRLAKVERSFGNKTTWDTAFEKHFRRFVREANRAIFDSGLGCQATYGDALKVEGDFDLVYLDAPYISEKGVVDDYLDFYHFLEGLVDYEGWRSRIDYSQKHRPFKKPRTHYSEEDTLIYFKTLIEYYSDSIIAISYRSDGIPSQKQLVELLSGYKKNVKAVPYGEYQYALSSNGHSKEVLLIGK